LHACRNLPAIGKEANMTIRRATKEDGAALITLIESLALYEKLAPPDAAATKRLLGDMNAEHPKFEAILAEEEGKAVGYAIIFETYSSFAALPVLYLEDLFVLPAFRKQKIGLELFRALVREARRRGCCRIEWVVLSWNEPAISFYKRIGAVRLDEWETFRLPKEAYETVLGDRSA